MKTPEDEEFERIEQAQKQIQATQALREELEHASKAFDVAHENYKRNEVLEEVAQEIEKFKTFGADTISSFAAYVRAMKK